MPSYKKNAKPIKRTNEFNDFSFPEKSVIHSYQYKGTVQLIKPTVAAPNALKIEK